MGDGLEHPLNEPVGDALKQKWPDSNSAIPAHATDALSRRHARFRRRAATLPTNVMDL